jgi:acyl-[acyl-carrier-protein]-phospholipid O-acyltransferase / long-chain-fatty-acid--[acyl-carrier-protein] ligase
MSNRLKSFFFTNRFFPLFVTQAMGAFNDNLLKQAFGLLLIYEPIAFGYASSNESYATFILIVAKLLFTIPFCLFSAAAGQIADRYERSSLAIIIKCFEVFLMSLASLGLILGQVWLVLLSVFFVGLHSTIFGPIKYSLLPDHLEKDELVGGNALIEAGTFLSILFGTLIASPLVQIENSTGWIAFTLILCSLIGLFYSRKIPIAKISAPNLIVDYNILRSTTNMIKYSYENKRIFTAIIGISWFWIIGALLVTLFAPFAKQELYADEDVVSAFLAMLSIGIAAGSLFSSRLLKGEVSAKFVPVSCLLMTIFIFDLAFCGHKLGSIVHTESKLLGLYEFSSTFTGIRVLFDLLGIAISGGVYVVPLYAILQSGTEVSHRARVIASNNIVNSIGILISGLLLIFLQQFVKLSNSGIFFIFSVLSLIMTFFSLKLLPRGGGNSFLKKTFKVFFNLRVKNLSHFNDVQNDSLVIIANHVSKFDSLAIACSLPSEKLTIFLPKGQLGMWCMLLNRIVEIKIVDYSAPKMEQELQLALSLKRHCVVFPEGRIGFTGGIMRIYEETAKVISNLNCTVLPIFIGRLGSSRGISVSSSKKKWVSPSCTVTIQPPLDLKGSSINDAQKGELIYKSLCEGFVSANDAEVFLFTNLWRSAKKFGFFTKIVEDEKFKPHSYLQLLLKISFLKFKLNKPLIKEQVVGVLLPNSIEQIVTLFAILAEGKIPALLNYSLGEKSVEACAKVANLRVIVTSKKFLDHPKLEGVKNFLISKYELVFLEDLVSSKDFCSKLFSFLSLPFIEKAHKLQNKRKTPEDTALILFTSGSEGNPKGVALSHKNLNINLLQLKAKLDLKTSDVLFNPLPLFHSFGLNVGTFLPLFSGFKNFIYHSPLNYKHVPELVYKSDATILIGTDTFLKGYGLSAHPFSFYSLRYVFAGAEKLTDVTRSLWSDKFGIRILEGYGVTECAPVLSINTTLHNRSGSVGKFIPFIEYRLRPVPELSEGGILEVRGPNVMKGYLEESAQILPLTDGWYDTGDMVKVDCDGFLFILGREKRFAKLGGEMISLAKIEEILFEIWSDHNHAVILTKGEDEKDVIVAYTTFKEADRLDLTKKFKHLGYKELLVPKKVVYCPDIPLLPTGKINYKLLLERIGK